MKQTRIKNIFQPQMTAAIACSLVIFSGFLQAATLSWDGGGGDANWSTGTNWDGDVAPTYNTNTYETLNFAGTTNLTANNDYGDGNNTDSILFDASAGAFTLTGGSIDMLGRASNVSAAGVASVTNNSTNTQTINNNLINRADFNTSLVFQNTAGGSIVVNGSVTEAGGSATLSKISGGSLELTGTGNTATNMNAAGGNTILSGTSTTTVSNTLYVANSGISGGGGGTLTVQDSATLTSTNLLVGNNSSRNGTVNQTGGTVNLTGSGANDIRLGHWGNLTGTYNLTGGTLNTLNTNFILGWDGQGILNVDGGTANLKGIHYGASTSVGTLNLDGGTLKLGSGGMTDIDRNGQSGNSTINLESGTLGALASWSTGLDMNLNGSVNIDTSTHNIDLSGDIAGAGTLTKLGTGALTLSGTGNTASELNVARGSLVLSGNSDTTVSGNLNVSLSGVAGGGVGSLTVQDSAVLNVGGNFNVGQNLSTNGSVTQTGGTVNMSGDVTMGVWSNLTATYTISGGTLNVQNNWLGLGNDGKGFLNIDGGVVNAKGVRYGYKLNGARAGTLNLDGGTLNVGSSGMYQGINGTINLNSGTLGSLASWSTGMGMNLGGAVDINTTGGDISLSGALAGAGQFTKTGSGTLTLSEANTYSGGTTINGGTLSLGSGASQDALGSGAVTVNSGGSLKLWINPGGSYTIDNAFTMDGGTVYSEDGQYNLTGAMTLNAGGGTLGGTWENKYLQVSGVISGAGGLTIEDLPSSQTGDVILSGVNTYTGNTTVSSGTLTLSAADNNIASSATIDVSSGATLDVSGVTNGFALASGQTLSGAGSIAGDMTIASGAVLSPGNSPGTMITGAQTWNDGGTYLWEINDSGGTQGAGSGWDWLDITGTLNLTNLGIGGFTIDIDSLTSGNAAGNADGFDTWTKGAPGDVDYSFIIATVSGGVTDFSADKFSFDSSGFSNAPGWDWQIILSGGDLVLEAYAVPEPSSTALLGLGGLALMLRRKRS
jgi:fibronectin-binding autotransporter adhesin